MLPHHEIALVDVLSAVYMLEDSALSLGSERLYRKCHWAMPGTEASQDNDHVFPVDLVTGMLFLPALPQPALD